MKKKTEQINVVEINEYIDAKPDRKEYYINAELVKDYDKTPAEETVAWNGTLRLYNAKGKYYLWHHSGNAAHHGFALIVPEKLNDKIQNMSADEAHRAVFY